MIPVLLQNYNMSDPPRLVKATGETPHCKGGAVSRWKQPRGIRDCSTRSGLTSPGKEQLDAEKAKSTRDPKVGVSSCVEVDE